VRHRLGYGMLSFFSYAVICYSKVTHLFSPPFVPFWASFSVKMVRGGVSECSLVGSPYPNLIKAADKRTHYPTRGYFTWFQDPGCHIHYNVGLFGVLTLGRFTNLFHRFEGPTRHKFLVHNHITEPEQLQDPGVPALPAHPTDRRPQELTRHSAYYFPVPYGSTSNTTQNKRTFGGVPVGRVLPTMFGNFA